ncbi:hypothetical protein CFO_g2916 [Ceratocystis platani]|uniref:Uncharacterized protein n=1 Tax=Ceratocystis fimbriata f. sp. platani TaxID=88771 RepID=A0A0F8DFE6_CERFI|nr:hypothetical protein CFO_g2916 [Ceratocystis platani]
MTTPTSTKGGISGPGRDTHPGGIISNAIAMAEKMSVTTGNDNVSLLAQHTESKTTPTETQFTFVCDSPDAGTVKWPGPGMQEVVVPYDPHYMPSPTEQYSQPVEERRISTRTAPPPAEKVKEPAPMTMEQQRQEKRKNRRVLEKELAEQARERRFQTRRRLSKNPPPAPLLDEEEYICLFCDYEAIFGEPPRYLIRSFELRARNERIEEEKKRRRLEQVKARNRKGKKATAGKTPVSKGSTAGSTKTDGLGLGLGLGAAGIGDDDDDDDDGDAVSTDDSYRMDSSDDGDADVEEAQLEDEFGGTIHAKIRDLTVRVHRRRDKRMNTAKLKIDKWWMA